jgi:hypothetical protein
MDQRHWLKLQIRPTAKICRHEKTIAASKGSILVEYYKFIVLFITLKLNNLLNKQSEEKTPNLRT